MRSFILLSIFFMSLGSLSSQGIRKASASYQVKLTRTITEEQACQMCMEIAMAEAIEKQFGRVLIQGNSTYVENAQTGERTESRHEVHMIADTYVNGEWIETLEESCERFSYEEELWVRCNVKGKVWELKAPKLDLTVKALDCENLNCETTDFKEGESLYLFVKSPVSGYLTIYLSDAEIAQRLLPYPDMPDEKQHGIPIEADIEYILFSSKKDALGLNPYMVSYEMYAQDQREQNRIYLIFSKLPLTKPALSFMQESESLLPMQLGQEAFQRWLSQQRVHQEDVQVFSLDVTIHP